MSNMYNISQSLDDIVRAKFKAMGKNIVTCSDVTQAVASDCNSPFTNRAKSVQLAEYLAQQAAWNGVKVEQKTIYNRKGKTTEQITEILVEAERQFLEANPDYAYHDYRYEDGPHGERTVFLMFKKKQCSQ